MAEKTVWDEWEKVREQIRQLLIRKKELEARIYRALSEQNGKIQLTRRQEEVIEALYGPPIQCNKEIAAKLNLSERAVKFHIAALLLKYKVRTRQDLVVRFQKPHEGETL
jgi:DNA-binding NarL/FixJ family response regulator